MWNYKIAMATTLVSQAKMASRFKKVTNEEVTELKEAAENSNTRKSTINWVLKNSDNFPRLEAREISRILTRRAWNYFLISLVTIWLHILISRGFSCLVPRRLSFFEGQERAKDNGKGKRPLSPSRGPSRFKLVTSRTCLALALTTLEASEDEAVAFR